MEILPNWHPILVHFTIAFVVTCAISQIFRTSNEDKQRTLESFQNVLTPLAFLAILATVATGLYAYYTVQHDSPSHAAMTDHRNWAFITTLTFVVSCGLWKWSKHRARAITTVLFALSLLLISVTGFKGGELVFQYGVGVRSMPEVSGDGHDHDHDHSAGQDELSPPTEDSPGFAQHAELPAKQVVAEFSQALQASQVARVSELLDPNVLIVEGGGIERSLQQYAAHHMKADMKYLSGKKVSVLERQAWEVGDAAYVVTRSTLQGSAEADAVVMSETMVLRRIDGLWKIAHIHWSN